VKWSRSVAVMPPQVPSSAHTRNGTSSVVRMRGRTPAIVLSRQVWPTWGSAVRSSSVTDISDDCHSGRLRGSAR
jgi:hypothetical protein